MFNKLKSYWPHLAMVLAFFCIVLFLFFPAFQGKKIQQSDTVQAMGVNKEIVDYRESNGEEPLWTNQIFGGMPTFMLTTTYPGDMPMMLRWGLSLGIPWPVCIIFMSFLSFYVLMLVMKVDFRLAGIAALAFGLATYGFLLLEAGHNTKALAIAFMPGVLAGVWLGLKGNIWKGAWVTGLFTMMEVHANHPQITYYLLMILFLFAAVETVGAVKAGALKPLLKRFAILAIAGLLGAGANLGRLWTIYEYSKFTIRGKSELAAKQNSGENNGVSLDYATAWSNGKAESFTLLIPNFMGGASGSELSKDSELGKAIGRAPNAKQILKSVPTYWGDQPFTSGPFYLGAITIFLFILSLFVLQKQTLWWIIPAAVLSLLLSWGKHFMWFTELFYHYVPLYKKFRAVSMTLVMLQLLLPFAGFYGLAKWMEMPKVDRQAVMKKALISMGALMGLLFVAGSMMDFQGPNDATLASRGWPMDAIQSDRASMFRSDWMRSLLFIAVVAVSLWLWAKEKLKSNLLYAILGLTVLIDLAGVNNRYLNSDDYVSARKMETPYQATQADMQIKQDPDPHYRVFNTSERLDAGARTAYFHKTLGGYSAAKMMRYQDLIETHIGRGNQSVINMLNAKYILQDQGNGLKAVRNPNALGNAWLVKNVKFVPNADAELAALNNFKPAEEAIVDERFKSDLSQQSYSGQGSIRLTQYDPKEMVYAYQSDSPQLAVFSEIYYPKGWKAYIGDEEAKIVRVNYTLRAIEMPAGNHTLTMKFEPTSYHLGSKLALVCSLLILLGFPAMMYFKGKE